MLGGLLREQRAISVPWQASSDWGVWPGESSVGAVSPLSALQLLAVHGSVRFIADGISALPVDAYRQLPDGSREEIAVPGWVRFPTPDLDWGQWCGQMLVSLLLHGNAFAQVLRGESRQIVALVPLDPSLVSVTRVQGRRQVWLNGREFRGEMLHITGMMLPGSDVGLSPIEYARQSVGLGLAAQQYGRQFFDGEGNMPGVIEMPGAAQPGTMKEIAENWRRKRTKGGRGLPGVLEGGATWKPTGVTNEQAQFLATRGYTAAEIAGQLFFVDPTELGIPVEGTSITYANLEQRGIHRVQVTFLPWIVRLEKAVSNLMASPRFIKLNVDGQLRADSSARWTIYETAMRINDAANRLGQPPVMTTPEMRDFEDLSVITDFTPASPAATAPAEPAPAA